jgi:hypothetical protein
MAKERARTAPPGVLKGVASQIRPESGNAAWEDRQHGRHYPGSPDPAGTSFAAGTRVAAGTGFAAGTGSAAGTGFAAGTGSAAGTGVAAGTGSAAVTGPAQ